MVRNFQSRLASSQASHFPPLGLVVAVPAAMMALDYAYSPYLWILVGFSFIYYYVSSSKSRQRLPLPPGPKPLPLLGNTLDLPLAHEYLQYAKWGEEYGDVCHITALGKHIIILNSATSCTELLDQRSAIYSDRPSLPMMDEPDL